MPPLEKTIYTGPFVHSKSLSELEICPEGTIGVAEDGKIAFINRSASASPPQGWSAAKTLRLPENSFYFPGFIGENPRVPSNEASRILKPKSLTFPPRYAHPRSAIPQRRRLWQKHPPRLAQHLHVPTRKLLQGAPASTQSLQPRRRPYPVPRHNNRLLLRH